MAEHVRYRKPRNPPQLTATTNSHNPETDPNSSRSKPTISSILLSSGPTNDATSKKKNFSSATFRGLGCTASPQVSVPAVIRTSANWEAKKLKKKRLKTKKSGNDELPMNNSSAAAIRNSNPSSQSSISLALSSSCVGVPDVLCGPGMGLTTDAASVDCVVSRRPPRGKVDGVDRIFLGQRERSCTVRRMVTPEDNPFLESEVAFGMPRIRSDVSGSRHHRHVRHGFREGLAEIVMLQNSLLMGGRSDGLDRYRDLRLDVDNMSYEELLELGDRIGYVCTGLRENEITCCLTRTKLAMSDDLPLHFASETERKCSICQEEYELDDETGKLNCGHFYHIDCIKQWLGQKNTCPICKTAAVSQTSDK
ncbi:putative E3 ubiquitin-protein ligase RHG1A [Sesamum alatum]|uniref:RING-type E3 ubiquitin transferase n=1 Tax=Sesamum alatum TaxID=300844 RepID=A0AAE1YAN8_9LAMI|nr:putative E3 ubiquitin-protein ligase RHG1A [Sesamum alatum]